MDRKKELSNIRRLQSLKEKKQERSIQAKQIKSSLCSLDSKPLSNKKIIFHSDDESDTVKESLQNENKKGEETGTMQLFDSSSEDSGDEDVNRFRIKPHLQQQKKLEFLEHTGDERFQLNDIFMEDMEEENAQEQMAGSDDEKDEKQKNLEILQSILGFQLPKTVPAPPTAKKLKKYVHFNPEDEESLKYLKKVEIKEKEEKTVTKEKEETMAEPQVSPARYFEVSADLKNVLEGTDGEFCFSKMFGYNDKHSDEASDAKFTLPDTQQEDKSEQHDKRSPKSKKPTGGNADSLSVPSAMESGGIEDRQKFFILPGDPRLTEGVEFFKRNKTEEQIQEDFLKIRPTVLDILKQRHRRGLRARHVAKNKKR